MDAFYKAQFPDKLELNALHMKKSTGIKNNQINKQAKKFIFKKKEQKGRPTNVGLLLVIQMKSILDRLD